MPERLRLPAFARALIDNRRRGFHPLRLTLLYGDNWRTPSLHAKNERHAVQIQRLQPYSAKWMADVGEPMLAIEPRDFEPGKFDFRCVAGTAVRLIDALDARLDVDLAAKRWGFFYDLVAELSDWAATVRIAPIEQDAATLAWEQQCVEAGRFAWPRWWSDQRQREHDQRYITWLADNERAILGRAA